MTDGFTDEPSQVSPATWGVVLAAGRGERFGQRKQYVEVGGYRLVDLAVDTISRTCGHVAVVLPPGRAWDGPPVDLVVAGGIDRSSSVRSALAAIPAQDGIVVVHQAANPLATVALIEELVHSVRGGAVAAVPGLSPADVVRRVARGGVAGELLGRDDLVLIQTPGAFRLSALRAAHALGISALEDTALMSAAGHEVRVVPGDPRNVHVATAADLFVVEALLARRETG